MKNLIIKIISPLVKRYWKKKLEKMPVGELRKMWSISKKEELNTPLTPQELEFQVYFLDKLRKMK